MPETPKVNPEPRTPIDGKLVDADSGKTFENINPATEEVLDQTADASPAEMLRAIDAARRAFDETDWSTNRTFRKRCIEQLQEALEAEREHPREELVLERGWYVEPALFTDVDNAMTFAQEEIFGPVLVVIPFEDDADAVRIANDSPRPGRRVSARSFERSLAVARSLRTGTLSDQRGRAMGLTCRPAATRPAGSEGKTALPVSTSTSRSSRWLGRHLEHGRMAWPMPPRPSWRRGVVLRCWSM